MSVSVCFLCLHQFCVHWMSPYVYLHRSFNYVHVHHVCLQYVSTLRILWTLQTHYVCLCSSTLYLHAVWRYSVCFDTVDLYSTIMRASVFFTVFLDSVCVCQVFLCETFVVTAAYLTMEVSDITIITGKHWNDIIIKPFTPSLYIHWIFMTPVSFIIHFTCKGNKEFTSGTVVYFWNCMLSRIDCTACLVF